MFSRRWSPPPSQVAAGDYAERLGREIDPQDLVPGEPTVTMLGRGGWYGPLAGVPATTTGASLAGLGRASLE